MAATITVICPSCNNRMRASAEFIGKRGRCPSCKALVEIAPSAEETQRSLRQQQELSGSSVSARRSYRKTTDAKGWLAGLIGIAATVALYAAIFYPIRNTYFGQLFVKRGPVPFVTTLFMCWGAAMLVLKYLAVRRQRGYSELELELIPLEVGLQVTPDNVDQFLDHISRLPEEQRQSILGRRIQGALEHFKHRTSVPEVQEYLSSQADLDSSGVDAGYTMLRAFIWAIPILGFIGTVMGISDAVSGLKDAMPAAEVSAAAEDAPAADAKDGQQETLGAKMMKAMGRVTDGLATAFDTTLIALVMAIMLLFPTEWLRKTEYRMLDRIEEFANESLLRRMSEGDEDSGDTPEFIRAALEGAFQEHQRWLAQWQAQVAQLGQVIGESFESAVMGLQDKLTAAESQRLQQVKNTAEIVGEMFDQFSQVNNEWQQASEQAVQNIEASLDAAAKLQHAVAENTRVITELSEQQMQALNDGRTRPTDALRDEIRGLRDDIKQLAAQSETLGELQPISVDNVRRTTGFFGLFRSRNAKKE